MTLTTDGLPAEKPYFTRSWKEWQACARRISRAAPLRLNGSPQHSLESRVTPGNQDGSAHATDYGMRDEWQHELFAPHFFCRQRRDEWATRFALSR